MNGNISCTEKTTIVNQIVESVLGASVKNTSLVPKQGNVNSAYFVETDNEHLVVRVRFNKDEMRQFECERHCANKIRIHHNWTPAILAIGRYLRSSPSRNSISNPHLHTVILHLATSLLSPTGELTLLIGEVAKDTWPKTSTWLNYLYSTLRQLIYNLTYVDTIYPRTTSRKTQIYS